MSGVWNGLGPYGKAAAVMGGFQMAGAGLNAIGAQKEREYQEGLIARQNQNIAYIPYYTPIR